MKLGKTAKNWLKIKEKLKFWHKKMVKNEEISWKEELSHPYKIIYLYLNICCNILSNIGNYSTPTLTVVNHAF